MAKRYKITVTEAQMRTMERALDLYARVGACQLEDVAHVLSMYWRNDHRSIEIVRDLMTCAKRVLCAELSRDANYGVKSDKVDNEFRRAFDVRTAIRRKLNNEAEDWYMVSDEPRTVVEEVDG